MKNLTQKQRVLEFLQTGNKLTRLTAWTDLGILEAPARILELRREGHQIKTTMVPVHNRFGEIVRIAEWSVV